MRVEGMRDVESRIGQASQRRAHASTIARSRTICDRRVVPAHLHHELVARSDAQPTAWIVLTHGIFGTGGNWRGIARKLVNAMPAWGVILVDLRVHGRSEVGSPPHTIAACAQDLVALVAQLELPVRVLAGHSFGGKVVLAARSMLDVAQTWMLDSSPSVRTGLSETSDDAAAVLALLERLPTTWPSRDAFVKAVVAERHREPFAQWLAMNVEPVAEGFALRFDLVALRALFTDFGVTDGWPAALDPTRGDLELVIADRGGVYTEDDLAKLAAPPPHVHVHRIDAGHWLHVEAADQMVALLASRLPG